MNSSKYKRRGWYGESHRHYLAAKGISTGRFTKRERYFSKNAPDAAYDEWMDSVLAKEAQLARYGVAQSTGSTVDIVDERGDYALIKYHADSSPPSESPIVYEIRNKEGDRVWSSGITYMAEFLAEDRIGMIQMLRKQAQEQFDHVTQEGSGLFARKGTEGWWDVFDPATMNSSNHRSIILEAKALSEGQWDNLTPAQKKELVQDVKERLSLQEGWGESTVKGEKYAGDSFYSSKYDSDAVAGLEREMDMRAVEEAERAKEKERAAAKKESPYYEFGSGERVITIPDDQIVAAKHAARQAANDLASGWQSFEQEVEEGSRRRAEEIEHLFDAAVKTGHGFKSGAVAAGHGIIKTSKFIKDKGEEPAKKAVSYTGFAVTHPQLAVQDIKQSTQEAGLNWAPERVKRRMAEQKSAAQKEYAQRLAKMRGMMRAEL